MNSLEWEKVHEEQHINDGDDRISLLPDCILHYILSCLPTKEAVATCVLSKRWQYSWTSVPSIDFDDSMLYSSHRDFQRPLDVTCFMNFIDRVLLQRDKSSLKRFRLSCRVCFSASRINDWISAAIMHKVQELDLCLFVEEPFMLPCSVFDNQLIRVIKIEMNCTLQLPPRISFPCLKTLHLCLVTFPSDDLMQSLFSSCPSLEELAILDCEWMNLKSISISMPSLKILIMDDLPFCSADDFRGCEIKINAGNLILFKYNGFLSNVVNVVDISSSCLALIHIRILSGRHREMFYRTFKLFRGLKSASGLRISGRTIEPLLLADKVLDYLPKFENLTVLELRGEIGRHSVQLLIKFLGRFPKLECLHLYEGLGLWCKDDSSLEISPNCIFFCLKTINYHMFHGTDAEVCFLKYLLQNAVLLEKMKVFWSQNSSVDPKNQEEIKDLLQAHPRGSSHCVLTLT